MGTNNPINHDKSLVNLFFETLFSVLSSSASCKAAIPSSWCLMERRMGSAVESSGMACSMAMLWGSTFWSDLLLLLGSSMQSFTSTDEKGTSLGRWTSNWSSNSSTKNYYQLLQIEVHLLILILNNINIYIYYSTKYTKKHEFYHCPAFCKIPWRRQGTAKPAKSCQSSGPECSWAWKLKSYK